jgi:translation initiation factor IF-3
LCNEDIPFTTVTPVDPETGRLKEPCRLKDLLASIDRKTHFVELVYDSKTAATNVLQQVPIVKIIARADRFQSRKAGKLSRPRQIQQKEVQLTWGVADGDLSHKLNKVRQELEKGNKVDLVFAPKAGTKAPSPVARQGRMESAMRMLGDVAKEWKERETKGLVVVIFLQENLVKSSKSGDAKPK